MEGTSLDPRRDSTLRSFSVALLSSRSASAISSSRGRSLRTSEGVAAETSAAGSRTRKG